MRTHGKKTIVRNVYLNEFRSARGRYALVKRVRPEMQLHRKFGVAEVPYLIMGCPRKFYRCIGSAERSSNDERVYNSEHMYLYAISFYTSIIAQAQARMSSIFLVNLFFTSCAIHEIDWASTITACVLILFAQHKDTQCPRLQCRRNRDTNGQRATMYEASI